MPARVFRSSIKNTVEGHTLVREDHRLCGGCWTERWEPPETIPSGSSGAWQSESSGIMTGTQGWVKYRLRRNSNETDRALVYIYWTNPYHGVTGPKFEIVSKNLLADCEEHWDGELDSFFGGGEKDPPPPDLFLDVVGLRRNGNPANVDDLADFFRIASLPHLLFTTQGIWERMEIDYSLRSIATPTPLFPKPKPWVRSIETKPEPATFVGTWIGQSISVSLALVGPRRLHVRLKDQTQPNPMELEVDTSLSMSGAVRAIRHLGTKLVAASSADDAVAPRSAAMLEAIAASISDKDKLTSTPPWQMATVEDGDEIQLLSKLAVKNHAAELGIETFPGADAVSAVVAQQVREADYILHLGSGIALYLVRHQEDGEIKDYMLHYQRIAENGDVLVDTDLAYQLRVN